MFWTYQSLNKSWCGVSNGGGGGVHGDYLYIPTLYDAVKITQ